MNKQKANSYPKLFAVFLVAIILVFSVGLVADGWQESQGPTVDNNSDKIDSPSDKVDENTNTETNDSQGSDQPEIYIPKYVNYLTGLECSENLYVKRHGAFIFNSKSPLYGISNADMIIEFPTESGETRFAALINNPKELGKIGSIAPTRNYISSVINYFNSFEVRNGIEGVASDIIVNSGSFDMSINKGYHYTEFGNFVYTNGNMISAGIGTEGVQQNYEGKETLPYNFAPFGKNLVCTDRVATNIKLPFSDSDGSELRYYSSNEKYTLIKNGSAIHDMLSGKTLEFDNCIILFANSVTYETMNGIDFNIDTSGSGLGYYLTKGTVSNISWSVSESGELLFLNDAGEILTVNRGSMYISYIKASLYEKTVFS